MLADCGGIGERDELWAKATRVSVSWKVEVRRLQRAIRRSCLEFFRRLSGVDGKFARRTDEVVLGRSFFLDRSLTPHSRCRDTETREPTTRPGLLCVIYRA